MKQAIGPSVFAGVLFVAVTLAGNAQAGPPVDVQMRARCAQVELSKAIGESVDPEDVRMCRELATRPRPPRPEPTTDTFKLPPPLPPKAERGRPDWIDQPPSDAQVLYGVGTGAKAPYAFAEAVSMIAAQLQVDIDSKTDINRQEWAIERRNGKKRQEKSFFSEDIRQATRMVVSASLEDVRLVDQWTDPKARDVWVLASLDLGAMKSREDALIESILDALTTATQLVADEMARGVLSQDTLVGMLSALGDVQSMGRRKFPDRVRDAWEKASSQFQRAAKDLLSCVEVSGTFMPGRGAGGGIRDGVTIPDGSALVLKMTCRGIPIVNATMRTVAEGGFVQLPDKVVTDGEGVVETILKGSRGRGVTIGFVHDLKSRPGAFWVGSLRPRPQGQFKFSPARPAEIRFIVEGGTDEENSALAQEMRAFATKAWGAIEADRGGRTASALELVAHLRFSPSGNPGSKVSVPVEAALTLRTPSGGVLWTTEIRAGALAQDEESARDRALQNLLRMIGRSKFEPLLDPAVTF